MHRNTIFLCLLGVFSLSVVLAANECSSGVCCDLDTGEVKPNTAFCAAENDCNNQRLCDGSSSTCPPNPKMNAGFTCSSAINRCHEDGKCDNSGTCLPQQQKATGAECVAANNGACANARTCTAQGTCAPKTAAGNTVVCHVPTTLCDRERKCPAAGTANQYTCPASAPESSSKVCREENLADCREATKCPGNRAGHTYAENIVCPAQIWRAAGATCDEEGNGCTAYVCTGTSAGCTTHADEPYAESGDDCTSSASPACSGSQTATCNANGDCSACSGTPGGTDDPLIAGFHHQRFWLEGESGKFYNMFSQPGMTINARIVNARSASEKIQTVMGEIAFITKNNVVKITPALGASGNFSVNGKTVVLSAKANLYDLDDCVQMAWSPRSVLLSSPEFEVIISFVSVAMAKAERFNVDFLNIKMPHVSGDATKMSGVIGQTAHEANDIDKQWTDFEVSDLAAHDSTKNTFNGADLACENSEASKRNVGKFEAATNHQIEDMKIFANSMA